MLTTKQHHQNAHLGYLTPARLAILNIIGKVENQKDEHTVGLSSKSTHIIAINRSYIVYGKFVPISGEFAIAYTGFWITDMEKGPRDVFGSFHAPISFSECVVFMRANQ